MFRIIILVSILFPFSLFAQNFDQRLQELNQELNRIREQEKQIEAQIEAVKLQRLRYDLQTYGLPAVQPGEEVIAHEAFCLVYSEAHEQALWVAHIISPDIVDGKILRTNDFRPDPAVKTGTAIEEDYFLKVINPDSTIEYDGYGYDRGHLAPSADFRWSEKALSESYYYSNMSPQLPEFNRGVWAGLENRLREYVQETPGVQLYVVTGPVLKPGLPVVIRSRNKLAIPEAFWKVALDLENKRAIGFLIPHQATGYPLESYALPIDRIEQITGIDFFPALDDALETALETQLDPAAWLPSLAAGDVAPLDPPSLPRNHFNTIQAKRYMGSNEEVNICGTVVGARTSRQGNVLLNLDKQFPNQVFTVFVRKEHLPNFSYDPEKELMGKVICVKGKVVNLSGLPALFVSDEKQIVTGGE